MSTDVTRADRRLRFDKEMDMLYPTFIHFTFVADSPINEPIPTVVKQRKNL
jgi:hypothetical protein